MAPLTSWFRWYLFVSGDLAAARSLAASSYETYKSDYGADAKVTLSAAANLATILAQPGTSRRPPHLPAILRGSA